MLALEAGVTFAVGSDAHRREELFAVEYPTQVIERLNIPEERIFLPRRKKA
jgi:histidinol phosphatase-like PHP family hydrolase